MYFTVAALDAIHALHNRSGYHLNPDQHELAQFLRTRAEITENYWFLMATYGDGRWPLEDIPWTTTDSESSVYSSLFMTSITIRLMGKREQTNRKLRRITNLLKEFAGHGRITRRVMREDDPGAFVHVVGRNLELVGSDKLGGPTLGWRLTDYAFLLLKRTLELQSNTTTIQEYRDLMRLAQLLWHNLNIRRHGSDHPHEGLWDNPTNSGYPIDKSTDPIDFTWRHTFKAIDCLVLAAENIRDNHKVENISMNELTQMLLTEANRELDRVLLQGHQNSGEKIAELIRNIERRLRWAEEQWRSNNTGMAIALVFKSLEELHPLKKAKAKGQ